jgi:hypothetical protein
MTKAPGPRGTGRLVVWRREEQAGQKAASGTSMRSLSVASAMARSAPSLGSTFLA